MADETEKQALALLDLAFGEALSERVAFIEGQSGYSDEAKQRALSLLPAEENNQIATGGALLDASEGHLPPDKAGPWKIGELIGRGGMASVYRTERDNGDFEQRVAIKFVTAGRANEKLIFRLRQERRLLATLNHPNISQFIDGGEALDGTPYIVTELVEGTTLQTFIEQNEVSLKERMRIFEAVLSGVTYAHKRSVVHRDLSPANILIRNDGVVKIIDFGIAMSTDDMEDTVARQSVTEGFTAPERIAGGTSTTVSDIFSLGKILTWLLGDLSVPRHRDLEAIATTAAAAAPDQRYGSVELLGLELERYRNKRSVHARGRELGYRLSRFSGRHPLSLTSAGLVMIAALTAVAALAVLYVRADQAEREAVARFDSLSELSRTVLFDIYDAVDRIPLTDDAQVLATTIGRQYLEELENDPRASLSLNLDIAEGFTQLGHIISDSNKDFFFDPETAEEHWQEAERRLDAVLDSDPPNVRALIAKAQLIQWQTQADIFAQADNEAALARYDQADALLNRALLLEPLHPDALLVQAAIRSSSGNALMALGRNSEARTLLSSSLAELEALPSAVSNSRGFHLARSNQRRTLGRILTYSDEPAEAVSILTASVVNLDEAELETGPDRITRRARSLAHWRRAYAHNQLGQTQLAIDDYETAIAITDRRLAIDPENKDAAYNAVAWSAEMSLPLSSTGRFAEAEAALDRAGFWYKERYDANPADPRRIRTMLVHNAQLMELHRAANQPTERCQATAELIRYTDELAGLGKLSPEDAAGVKPYRAELEACRS
ncbi:MAG: protein kinase [Parvularculaceae bacterium]|nr:protein kinase [Parvularculaceae bacterium]